MSTDLSDSNPDDDSPWKWLTGGWAKGMVVVTFLAACFYLEEDWRGAVLWQQAQADIAAQGESLDPKKFILPPVPDEQNFAALPIFQLEPDPTPSYPANSSPVEMNQALARVEIPYSKDDHDRADLLPYLGNWKKGEKPDLPAIKKRLTDLCHRSFPTSPVPPHATPVELFGLLCPTLADLRGANKSRPLCQFDQDYISRSPLDWSATGIVSTLKLAKFLAYEERLALINNQSQIAAEDLEVGWKVNSGLEKEPLLIAGLLSAAVTAIQRQVIMEGLVEHAWSDQQLVDIDNDLGKIDFLAETQFCVRGDVVVFGLPHCDYFKNHRLRVRELFGYPRTYSPTTLREQIDSLLFVSIVSLLPNGWFDELKADDVRINLLGTVKIVDPHSHRGFPEREERTLGLIEDPNKTVLWHAVVKNMTSSTVSTAKQFTYSQALTDEARIACRLERYRLAHGVYPDSLEALTPAYGADLPRDVMNGQLYHYKLLPDGTFLLYSVGWNQIDDGGKTDDGTHTPPLDFRTAKDPDWVWDNHPDPKETK